MDTEIMFSWWWNATRWLKEIVKVPTDLDSPLPQICQNRFIPTEFLAHSSLTDVDYKYPVVTGFCHCPLCLVCGNQVDGCRLSYRFAVVVNLPVAALVRSKSF